jgi:hypothetical protein
MQNLLLYSEEYEMTLAFFFLPGEKYPDAWLGRQTKYISTGCFKHEVGFQFQQRQYLLT